MTGLLALSLLNGLAYGLLLFLLSSGLTLIFSMMGVLNFAHASFYMLGAYLAYQISQVTGFWVGLVLAPLAVAALGALVERYGLRQVHRHGHVAELLFTFGLAFLIEEIVQLVWGRAAVEFPLPAPLREPLFMLGGIAYPVYRVFMMAVAVGCFLALLALLKRTRVGLVVQAALTHPRMVGMLGHNVPLVFMSVFAVGAGLAGLAGVIGGSALVTEPAMARELGPIVFVVVVVGGLGSIGGAFIASLAIGVLQTLAIGFDVPLGDALASLGVATSKSGNLAELWSVTLAQIAPLLPYLLLILVLIVRPRGIAGRRDL
ncbi:branched-chain amino acid ABC transporter permease [Bosea sp. (in: a-proteobacteria)]|uniref:branched-chain amino acid ABC transporter permease n=1 Tax=Bosea sp. (in: a-proteobacteria) TaxID=1871050 RepID=UPI002623247A|nr:branched-chain amino acid ABC transporter permease [Bosea sp. (in: a-proteobacteria)]MCO5090887.1 branched-chain amino acid ABC transporter permease [Bosea sp. (in: a-proteobacteria)]